jgi:hypothetical protein
VKTRTGFAGDLAESGNRARLGRIDLRGKTADQDQDEDECHHQVRQPLPPLGNPRRMPANESVRLEKR